MLKSLTNFLKNLNPDFVKLLTGSGLVFFFKILGALAGYILAYVITTSYGAETFGVFELCLTFLTIFSVLGRLDLPCKQLANDLARAGTIINPPPIPTNPLAIPAITPISKT